MRRSAVRSRSAPPTNPLNGLAFSKGFRKKRRLKASAVHTLPTAGCPMASIRRRRNKYEVQVRRSGVSHISRTFHALKDAKEWARTMEVRADRRDLPVNRKILERVTLGDLLERYRDTISNKKRSGNREFFMLNTMLRNPISRRRLSELVAAHFAAYRDDRLMEIKPSSVKRELAPVRHMFEVARHEWGFPMGRTLWTSCS